MGMIWLLSMLVVAASHQETFAALIHINPTNFSFIQSYIVSNSEIHFEPGDYYLNSSLVLDRVKDITLTGVDCRIICTSTGVGIVVTNVTNFKLHKVVFESCDKNYPKNLHSHIGYDYISFHGSLILHDCTEVVISNVMITVRSGNTGILAVNLDNLTRITNVAIVINCSDHLAIHDYPAQVNGILMYHYNSTGTRIRNVSYEINNLQYKVNGECAPLSQYVLGILLFQKNYNISVTIQNTRFNNLHNTSALYYYGETCGIGVHSNLIIRDVTVSYNVGNSQLKMFQFTLYNLGCFNIAASQRLYSKQQYNNITFLNCNFTNNKNMRSMIHMAPSSTRAITGYLNLNNTKFCHNQDVHYVNIERSVEIIWQLTNFIKINYTIVSSNCHSEFEGNDLISVTNGALVLESSELNSNQYYRNIIRIHMSPIFFIGSVEISNNRARHIVRASKDGSYFTMTDNSTVNIFNNTVYLVAKQEHRFGVDLEHIICTIQFYSKYGNMDDRVSEINSTFQLNIIGNQYMISKYYQDKDESLQNCVWIADSAFSNASSKQVFSRTLTMNNSVIGSGVERPIPLSVCPCSNNSDSGNCHFADLGKLFAGQTLHAYFTVPQYSRRILPITLIVENSESADDDCVIVQSSQLSQTHMNSSCNKYDYTIWPRWENITLCKLFVGLVGKPEMFFVEIKPCPMGFKRQENKQTCHCDPALDSKVLSITSCNLDDETIYRPANSWIMADNNNSLSYQVSPYCPFDYCLPHSSHLNLSYPDSQCQFKRTGVLCGQCQQGLSIVFGSPRCKPCSQHSWFIIAPVVIATLVLIVLTFKFNLTITNGTINNFIFFFDIVGINMEKYFPNCYSFVCIFAPSNASDMCFYHGMNSYAKVWIFLCYPLYIIFIAVLLVIASRYSTKVQRLTAQRVLPVLATLFLLSFTGLLRTVCFALFYYTTITHLPSNTTTLVWSIDSSVSIFGAKFIILFLVSLIFMFILVAFNILLLFTKELLRFRIISTIKPFLDVYLGLYNYTFSYWTGLQLLLRVTIFGFTALPWDTNLMLGVLLLTVFLCMQAIVQPFKMRFYNIQHSLVLLSLVTVNVISLYNRSNDNIGGSVAVKVIVFAVFVYFFTAIIGHCFVCAFNKIVTRNKLMLLEKFERLKDRLTRKKIADIAIEFDDYTSKISDVTYNYHKFQEPLVEFD